MTKSKTTQGSSEPQNNSFQQQPYYKPKSLKTTITTTMQNFSQIWNSQTEPQENIDMPNFKRKVQLL